MSGVSFNAATRVLSMSNDASLTLGGGIYDLCSFTASNNVTVSLASGVKTEIFIDFPTTSTLGVRQGREPSR